MPGHRSLHLLHQQGQAAHPVALARVASLEDAGQTLSTTSAFLQTTDHRITAFFAYHAHECKERSHCYAVLISEQTNIHVSTHTSVLKRKAHCTHFLLVRLFGHKVLNKLCGVSLEKHPPPVLVVGADITQSPSAPAAPLPIAFVSYQPS